MLSFSQTVFTLLHSFTPLCIGIYLLYTFKSIFKPVIGSEWLRVNIVVLLIIECLFAAFAPLLEDFRRMEMREGLTHAFLYQAFWVSLNTLPAINVVLALQRWSVVKRLSFTTRQIIIFIAIVVSCTLVTSIINYYNNNYETKYIKWAASFMVFSSALAGLGYLFYTYADYEKRQLLQARELENTKLKELKTQAELEALHSKINPHFLYNALNSIAELTITDNKKARDMTIALSDLFRYTINYNESNFSTVEEEIQMTKTYLEIEKIRFEDNLVYDITVDSNAMLFKIPRFILQPIVENAVKHGLKGVHQQGLISIVINKEDGNLVIKVFDNGQDFNENMIAGYGLKSVTDKLKLLFADRYRLEFVNSPRKHLLLTLKAA